MTRHVGALMGHVQVDGDPLNECLVCGTTITPVDRVGLHVAHDMGELRCPDDIASIPEWGHAG